LPRVRSPRAPGRLRSYGRRCGDRVLRQAPARTVRSSPPGAPALVLLHGAAATSLMWAPNIEALSREYRTVAVDQVGEFGKSVCTRPVQSLQDLIAWVHELIGASARERVSLVGMSYGGALAAQYALHFQERLQKVILLAPATTVL